MERQEFYFDLPPELIAQTPLKERDTSRLLTLNKETGEINHQTFRDIKSYLKAGDCLVLNNSRVIPARLFGIKENSTTACEVVLLKDKGSDVWECLVKPGKRLKHGAVIVFAEGKLTATVIDIDEDTGNRFLKFSYSGIFLEILEELGTMPLPHYIKATLDDPERYQTVYNKTPGSAAAPTAGLHFTNELLKEIEDMGVSVAYVTLHVGLGTFRPVKVDKIEEHIMHSEFYMLDEENAQKINNAKQSGNRVFAVGTTANRTIETIADENGHLKAGSGFTDIFIYPGYTFKAVDCLLTNFHLPESTLIMLISAFATREKIMKAYSEAIENKYRFFSFGDAMLIYKE